LAVGFRIFTKLGGVFPDSSIKLHGYAVFNPAARYHWEDRLATAGINNHLNKNYGETGTMGVGETFTRRGACFHSPKPMICFSP